MSEAAATADELGGTRRPALGDSAPPADDARLRRQVRAIGVWYYVFAGLWLALLLGYLGSTRADPVLAAVAAVPAAGFGLVGFGLRRFSPGARGAALFLSVLWMMSFPIGTVFGYYSFARLTRAAHLFGRDGTAGRGGGDAGPRGLRVAVAILFVVAVGGFGVWRAVVPAKPPGGGVATPPVTLTPEAVQQVLRYRDRHGVEGRWRVRVERADGPAGRPRYAVDLDVNPPTPAGLEYEYEGLLVVVPRSQVERLRGSTVGYDASPGREGFYVTDPSPTAPRE